MKLKIMAVGVVGAASLAFAGGSVSAGQPANPGCFGRDRAEWIAANSGQAWSEYAKLRAGNNGAINQDYKVGCGG